MRKKLILLLLLACVFACGKSYPLWMKVTAAEILIQDTTGRLEILNHPYRMVFLLEQNRRVTPVANRMRLDQLKEKHPDLFRHHTYQAMLATLDRLWKERGTKEG
jgi:hypothetical protein